MQPQGHVQVYIHVHGIDIISTCNTCVYGNAELDQISKFPYIHVPREGSRDCRLVSSSVNVRDTLL